MAFLEKLRQKIELVMRKLIIHPTHRRILRMLRERDNDGRPVILLVEERDRVKDVLPTLQSATARNQYVYRVLLRAIKRPFSEIQHCNGFIVVDKCCINLIEKLYAIVERRHFCGTVINAIELSLSKRR